MAHASSVLSRWAIYLRLRLPSLSKLLVYVGHSGHQRPMAKVTLLQPGPLKDPLCRVSQDAYCFVQLSGGQGTVGHSQLWNTVARVQRGQSKGVFILFSGRGHNIYLQFTVGCTLECPGSRIFISGSHPKDCSWLSVGLRHQEFSKLPVSLLVW